MILLKIIRLKNINLRNRIVMPPMCMYSSDKSGIANDFHYTHYVTRAMVELDL